MTTKSRGRKKQRSNKEIKHQKRRQSNPKTKTEIKEHEGNAWTHIAVAFSNCP
jgi:CRISPR/Cas system-associated endonuclease Cas1